MMVIEEFADKTVIRRTYKGQVLFEEGERHDEIIFLISGRASIRLEAVTPTIEVALNTVGAGAIMGESLLFGRNVSNASIVTLDPCIVGIVPWKELKRIFARYPESHLQVMTNLAEILSDRLSKMNHRILKMTSRQLFSPNGMKDE